MILLGNAAIIFVVVSRFSLSLAHTCSFSLGTLKVGSRSHVTKWNAKLYTDQWQRTLRTPYTISLDFSARWMALLIFLAAISFVSGFACEFRSRGVLKQDR
jgi:hypothetical protein